MLPVVKQEIEGGSIEQHHEDIHDIIENREELEKYVSIKYRMLETDHTKLHHEKYKYTDIEWKYCDEEDFKRTSPENVRYWERFKNFKIFCPKLEEEDETLLSLKGDFVSEKSKSYIFTIHRCDSIAR